MHGDLNNKTEGLEHHEMAVHKKQVDYLGTLLDNMNEFCYTYDPDGYLTFTNKKTLHTLQYQPSEMIGRFCWEFSPLDIQPAIQEDMKKRFETLDVLNHEYPVQKRDGGIILLHVRTTPIIQEGKIIAVMCISEDITEQRQAETALRASEEKFYKAFFGSPGLMSISTMDEGTFLEINDTFLSTTGYERSEILGTTAEDIGLWVKPETRSKAIAELKEKGLVRNLEIEFRDKSGSIHTGLWSADIIELAGQTCIISIIIDISERKKADELLRRLQEQTARAQKAASLSAMSAGIVHEIAQPLNTLKIMTDTNRYWLNKGRNIEAGHLEEFFDKAVHQIEHIEDIVHHMRSLAYLGPKTVKTPCSLNEALTESLTVLGNQIKSHGILLETQLSDNLPMVLAHPQRLEETIINLLVNAMQALDRVENQHKIIRCTTDRHDDYVVLDIVDNATGIDDKITPRIFDPFFSTKNTMTNMGLGLSIVQSIVISFDGEIRCWNNELGGATFRIEIPCHTNMGG